MRILIIASIFPFPPNSGARIRISECIKALSRSDQVTFIGFKVSGCDVRQMPNVEFICIDKKYPPKWVTLLKSMLSSRPYVGIKFWDRRLKHAVDEELKNKAYDVIWLHHHFLSVYLDHHDLSKYLVVMDEQSNLLLYADSFIKSPNSVIRALAMINAWKTRRYLINEFPKYTHHLSVSPIDMEHTKTWAPRNVKLLYAPNGVDLDYFRPGRRVKTNAVNILFCGSLNVTMNQDAVIYFADEIFPLVVSSLPNARFIVCGSSPSRNIRRLASNNVTITGTVDDVRDYYRQAYVCVAPFRYGGGTKLKILEAQAMKVPIVSTSRGCQGIDVEHEKNIMIANNAKDFAWCVIKMVSDRKLRKKCVEQGYKVAQRYSWTNIYPLIVHTIRADLNTLKRERECR